MEGQRVVVIQDASKEVCSSAIRWALQGLFLKPGDLLVLLGVLHQVNDLRTLSFNRTRKLLGYGSKVDSSSKFGANPRIVDREATRKEEYENNAEIIEISKLCRAGKVDFRIEVASGASPAVLAAKSAENMKATWVILDRKMKKNKTIFLEKLSCGISRMKRNNSIKLLRGPSPRTKCCVTYDDGVPEEDDLFSIELFPTCQAEAYQVSRNQKLAHTSGSADSNTRFQAEETFRNPTCIICDNRKPNVELRKNFTYVELHAATDGFSSTNNLSEGDVKCTFRGQLQNKLIIVVKPANNKIYIQEPKKFESDIDILSRVRHKNLAMLLGCCAEGSHRLLVYEFVCNSSLDQHLSKSLHMPLSWTQRLKVALGASRGLNHLHQNNIIHKDIRPNNILLNHEFEPLLGDFGLATIRSDQNFQTLRYLAPEYLEHGTLSTQTDVYSFGVVLLELITGHMTMDKKMMQKGFLTWAKELLKQRRYLELVDPRIANSYDVFQLHRMAQLAQKCLSKNPKKRLPVDKVVSTLECIIESGPRSSNEDHRLSKSYSCIKTVEQESSYEDVDVTSQKRMRSRSFSFPANVWTCPIFGISSSPNEKSYKILRAGTASTNQVHYGEMLN